MRLRLATTGDCRTVDDDNCNLKALIIIMMSSSSSLRSDENKALSNGTETVVDKICEAVQRNDAAGVCACLGFSSRQPRRGSGDLDEPLVQTTTQSVQALQDWLFLSEKKGRSVERILLTIRGLLWIPPHYEAPWRTTISVITSFQRRRQNCLEIQEEREMWTLLTDISTFLQQAVVPWLIPDNTVTFNKAGSAGQNRTNESSAPSTTTVTPRECIQLFSDALLRPLFARGKNEECNHNDQNWQLALEQLLPTLLSMCSALPEEEVRGHVSTHQYVLNSLFPEDDTESVVSGTCLLSWLNTALLIRKHLSEHHLERSRINVRDKLNEIPSNDLPGVMQTVLDFLTAVSISTIATTNHDIPSWHDLVLHVLHVASVKHKTAEVERVLQTRISTMSIRILRPWIESFEKSPQATFTASVPVCIRATLLLVLMHAIQQSGSLLVSNLVSRALGTFSKKKHPPQDADLYKSGWDVLTSLAFQPIQPQQQQSRRRPAKQNGEDAALRVHDMLRNVSYDGNGKVLVTASSGGSSRNSTASTVSILSSNAASLVYESLFLGGSDNEVSCAPAERAQPWVSAAETILCKRNELSSTSCRDAILVAWIVILVYIHVPESRPALVGSILQSLHVKSSVVGADKMNNEASSSLLLCAILSVLVPSICRAASTDKDELIMMEGLRPVAQVFSEPTLTRSTFCHLATSLSPLPFARVALLSACRKRLEEPVFAFGWGETTLYSQQCKQRHERITCAIYGLCALLDFTCVNRLDDCGAQASVILSDMLVLNTNPTLFLPTRMCLFRHLSKLLEEKRLSEDTKEHFLRASLVLFLRYCSIDHQTKMPCLLPERAFKCWPSVKGVCQKEDLVSLLRFILACSDFTEKSTNGRDLVVDMLTGENKQLDKRDAGFIPVFEVADNEPSMLCHASVSSCLVAVLQCLLRYAGSTKNTVINTAEKDGITQMQAMLVEQEILQHHEKGGRDESDTRIIQRYKPNWVQSHASLISSLPSRHTRHVVRAMYPLLSLLCDVVMDTIIDQKWCHSLSESCPGKRSEELKRISKSINALLRVKNSFAAKLHGADKQQQDLGVNLEHEDALLHTGGVVFEVASHLLKNLNDLSLDDTENLLQSVLGYCSSMVENGDTVTAPDVKQYVACVNASKSLWKLYLVIGNEDSAKLLIGYLERIIFHESYERLERGDDSQFSLRTLASSTDVDEAVRNIRQNILTTMLNLFCFLSNHAPLESTADQGGGLMVTLAPEALSAESHSISEPSNQRNVTEPRGAAEQPPKRSISDLSISVWTDCLKTFSVDLTFGVKGDSGGITPVLFTTILELIEVCTNTLVSRIRDPENLRPGMPQAIWDAGRDSIILLWKMLCSVSLTRSKAFKKTMMLSLHTLPSLYRSIVRARFSQGKLPREDILEGLGNFPVIVYDQCIKILERWAELDSNAAWYEVAGADHLSLLPDDGDEDSDNDSSTSSSDDESVRPEIEQRPQPQVPLMIEIPENQQESTSRARGDSTDEVEGGKLRLDSSKMWTWAFSCSILAMEKNWEESEQILQGTATTGKVRPEEQHSPSVPSRNWSAHLSQYSVLRERELSEHIRCVCAVLECEGDSEKPLDSSTNGRSGEAVWAVLATKLANETKMRLCSLLEKITNVMNQSVRNMIVFAKNPPICTGFCLDLDVVESMTCLSAWIYPQRRGIDFTAGTRRWFHAEKERKDASTKKAKGSYVPNEPFFSRLPKLLSQVEELEISLQHLDGVLKKHSGNSVVELEEFMYRIHDDSEAEDDTNSLLQRRVSQKLRQSADSSPALAKFGVAFIDGSTEIGKNGKKRKRSKRNSTIEKQMRKERRRVVVRSRNRVIDEMLQLDREAGRDPGEDENDAFLDLDDFLVEG